MIRAESTIVAIIPMWFQDPVFALSIRGRPVIDWTVRRLRMAPRIERIVLAVDGGTAEGALAAIDRPPDDASPAIAVGVDRVSAIRSALTVGGQAAAILVCPPDRALGSPSIVEELAVQSDGVDAVAAARPLRSTLKRVLDRRVIATVSRDAWRSEPGPWLFRRDALERALAAADEAGRSVVDAQDLALAGGLRVRLIDAAPTDFPIRTTADARFAERWLASGDGPTT